jgi:hypothetical protein
MDGSQRTFALFEGQTVRASAERYDLAGMLDGRRVRVCAVGSALGHVPGNEASARALIDALVDDAARHGAEVAVLFLPAGFETTGPREFVIRPNDLTLGVAKSTRNGAPMTTVRGGEERDLAAIAAMGHRFAERFRFHLERDVAFIRYVIARQRLLCGLGAANARQLQFYIAEEGITAAAYVVISVAGGEWTLEECGDRDRSGARVGALLQALIAREPSEHPPLIRAWLPAGFVPPQSTVVSSVPSSRVVRVRLLGNTPVASLGDADVLYWQSDLF